MSIDFAKNKKKGSALLAFMRNGKVMHNLVFYMSIV